MFSSAWRKKMVKTIFDLVKIKITGGISSMLSFMRGRETKKTGFSFGTALILAIVIIAFLFMMVFSFGIAMAVGFQMAMQRCMWLFYPLAFIVSTVFAFVGTVFAAHSYLFEAEDNELLLSMPIKPSAVLISRMLSLYVLNLVYSTLILFPVGIAHRLILIYSRYSRADHYGINNFGVILTYLITLLFVPALATALSCIIGYIIGRVSKKIPNKGLLTVVIGFSAIAVLAVTGLNLGPIISALINYIDSIAISVKQYLPLLYRYGISSHSGKAMWGVLPIMTLITALTLLVYKYMTLNFLKLVTKRTAEKKKKYKSKPMQRTGVQYALIKKEIGYFFSIPAYVMNAGMSTIMAAFLGISILLRGDVINEYLPVLFPDASGSLTALLVGSSLALCCTLNDVTAPSISLEGKTLWLLKSTPLDPVKIFLGKAVLSPVVSLPGVLFTSIAAALKLNMGVADVLFVIFIPLLACLFSGFLGVCINLRIPRFDWSTEITVIKQSLSVIITLLVSMFFTSIPFVLAIVPAAYLERFSTTMSYGICIIYFVLIIALEIFYLCTDGRKIWNRL